MGCAKIVFALVLTVLLPQQYSAASSNPELKEKAKSESDKANSVTKLLEQFTEKWGSQPNGNSSLQMEKLKDLRGLLYKDLLSGVSEKSDHKEAALSPSLQSLVQTNGANEPKQRSGANKFEELEKLRKRMSEMMEENRSLFAAVEPYMFTSDQLLRQTKEKTTQKLSSDDYGNTGLKSLQDCLSLVNDIFKQSFTFLKLLVDISTDSISDTYALLQCFQGGITLSTLTCVQQALSDLPNIIGNLENQTMSYVSAIESDITKLSSCLTTA